MYPLKYLPIQAQLVVTKCHYAGEECHMALVGWQKLKSRRWRGPVLSLPKDYLDFLSKSPRSPRLCGFFGKVAHSYKTKLC